MSKLQQTLYHARLAADMSLRQAEEASGVSFGYISHIENGRETPGPQVLYLLAEAYGVPPQDFYDLINYHEPTPFGFIRALYDYFTFNPSIKDVEFTNLAIKHNLIHPKTLKLKLKRKEKDNE